MDNMNLIESLPSGKSVALGILNVHNIEATWVTLSVRDNSNTT